MCTRHGWSMYSFWNPNRHTWNCWMRNWLKIVPCNCSCKRSIITETIPLMQNPIIQWQQTQPLVVPFVPLSSIKTCTYTILYIVQQVTSKMCTCLAVCAIWPAKTMASFPCRVGLQNRDQQIQEMAKSNQSTKPKNTPLHCAHAAIATRYSLVANTRPKKIHNTLVPCPRLAISGVHPKSAPLSFACALVARWWLLIVVLCSVIVSISWLYPLPMWFPLPCKGREQAKTVNALLPFSCQQNVCKKLHEKFLVGRADLHLNLRYIFTDCWYFPCRNTKQHDTVNQDHKKKKHDRLNNNKATCILLFMLSRGHEPCLPRRRLH